MNSEIIRFAITLGAILLLGFLINHYFDEGGPGGGGPKAA